MYDFSLKNKVIVFIAGYGYLAKGIVQSLINHDANVYILGRNNEKFNDAYDSLNKDLDEKIKFIACDANNTTDLRNSFNKIIESEKKIDVLINGAYGVKGGNPENISDDEWEYTINNSLNSYYKAIREILPYFKDSSNGKIINFSSMYGVVSPDPSIYENTNHSINPPHYGVAKAGIIQLTKYFANYLGKYNITVNAVSPGPFPSNEVKKDEAFIVNLSANTSLNRIGEPEDLGGLFTFLCSSSSNYITGQNIIVDGGWTIK